MSTTTINKLALAEYSAELMVYFEKHKIIEIITVRKLKSQYLEYPNILYHIYSV